MNDTNTSNLTELNNDIKKLFNLNEPETLSQSDILSIKFNSTDNYHTIHDKLKAHYGNVTQLTTEFSENFMAYATEKGYIVAYPHTEHGVSGGLSETVSVGVKIKTFSTKDDIFQFCKSKQAFRTVNGRFNEYKTLKNIDKISLTNDDSFSLKKILQIGITTFNNSQLGIIVSLLSDKIIDTFDAISLESRRIELENYAKKLNISPEIVTITYHKPYSCLDGEIHFEPISTSLNDLRNETTKHAYIKSREVTKAKELMDSISKEQILNRIQQMTKTTENKAPTSFKP